MASPTPCPPIFVNEPFKNYPPCPTPHYIDPIPLEKVTAVLVGFGVILVLLIMVVALALLVSSMTSD